jgi:hypothetical protein
VDNSKLGASYVYFSIENTVLCSEGQGGSCNP